MAIHLEQALNHLLLGGISIDDPFILRLQTEIIERKKEPQYQEDLFQHMKQELTTKLLLLKSLQCEWNSYQHDFLEGQLETLISKWNQENGSRCQKCKQIQSIIVDYPTCTFYFRNHREVKVVENGQEVEKWQCQL